MSELDELVVNLKNNIEQNEQKSTELDCIYNNTIENSNIWLENKKNQFKINKDNVVDNPHYVSYLRYVKNNDIPFEAVRLTMDELTIRNDIYSNLFIKNNINNKTILHFIDNIYLFIDTTKHEEIKEIIHNLLFIKEYNEYSKDILEKIKIKILAYNSIRKEFDTNKFVFECYKKIPKVGMCFKEHGRPYKKSVANSVDQQPKSYSIDERKDEVKHFVEKNEKFFEQNRDNIIETNNSLKKESEESELSKLKEKLRELNEQNTRYYENYVKSYRKGPILKMAIIEHGQPYKNGNDFYNKCSIM